MLGWLLVILISFSPNVSRADDGDLQRALLEAACANAKVTRLPAVGRSERYEANCFGTSHKRIQIVCIEGRCVADRPPRGREDPKE